MLISTERKCRSVMCKPQECDSFDLNKLSINAGLSLYLYRCAMFKFELKQAKHFKLKIPA